MSAGESSRYDSEIAEKANTPFAKRFRKIVPDAKIANALKEYLGVSIQAINQYKQGTAYPKTENLIKIADYFSISVDYLLGITDIPNRDTNMQAVHKFTGLSEPVISWLHSIIGDPVRLETLNAILGNKTFQAILPFIEELKNVQIAAEFDRFSDNFVPAKEISMGQYVVGGFEYLSVLEYRIAEWLKMVIDEVTSLPLDD